uniref:MHD domain-containing protein n=1 Tax=Meleagris gallopavo TaxID=9103 RepID=A0A803YDQ8_MELGA
MNMAALTGQLQKQAEQSPSASYYNVALLKYQVSRFSRLGPSSAPLRLCVRWDCTPGATRVSVEYGYNAGALALPVPLANVHVLLPLDEPVTNVRLQPKASWNLEEKRLLWKLLDVPSAPGQGGCGRLSASWQPLCGPSKPSPVAAQFSSEGSTLSGVEVELAGAGYRMSLVKKRFATGTWDPSPVPTACGCTQPLLCPLRLRCSGSLLCYPECTTSLLRAPQPLGGTGTFSHSSWCMESPPHPLWCRRSLPQLPKVPSLPPRSPFSHAANTPCVCPHLHRPPSFIPPPFPPQGSTWQGPELLLLGPPDLPLVV